MEALTDQMEKEANEIFDQIDSLGGVIPAIEAGYFQKEIADAAYFYQREVEKKEKIIVGVNDFVEKDEKIDIPILYVSPGVEKKQKKRLGELRQNRSEAAVKESLREIKEAGEGSNNLMPILLKAAQNYVTLGEMVNELKEVFGVYEETVVF